MNLILWLIIGGILGWLASIIMHTNAQQGIVLNIIVGIVGALLAGLLLTPLFGIGTINQSNFSWFCGKFRFWGKIRQSGISNSMTYRPQNSRKSTFATEPPRTPPTREA
jgi:uncharacterized membrane protein YeaQ/YmgE (transglycosylase-associated protein family)